MKINIFIQVTFVFEKNTCNHLIECQRPVLSLFINHQGLIGKEENTRERKSGKKKKQETLLKVDTKFEQIGFIINIRIYRDNKQHEKWQRLSFLFFLLNNTCVQASHKCLSLILDTYLYRTSSPHKKSIAMSATINYPDSYECSSSSSLNRQGSTRQYVSSLQRTLAVHAKPVLVKRDNHQELFPSTTSLSSTGYDSNSSPSILSKRNSLITNPSHDFSSSSDERYKYKHWVRIKIYD